MTKNEMKLALAALGVEVSGKPNVAALQALCAQHNIATEVLHLDPESPKVPFGDDCMGDESEEEAPAHLPPLPVTAKPVQVAIGLTIEKNRPEQNGVKRPSEGGRCRAVWDALDDYFREVGEQPTAKVVRELAADEGWNPNNASIEYYQWRKFHGITGRAPKVAAPVAAPEADA